MLAKTREAHTFDKGWLPVITRLQDFVMTPILLALFVTVATAGTPAAQLTPREAYDRFLKAADKTVQVAQDEEKLSTSENPWSMTYYLGHLKKRVVKEIVHRVDPKKPTEDPFKYNQSWIELNRTVCDIESAFARHTGFEVTRKMWKDEMYEAYEVMRAAMWHVHISQHRDPEARRLRDRQARYSRLHGIDADDAP